MKRKLETPPVFWDLLHIIWELKTDRKTGEESSTQRAAVPLTSQRWAQYPEVAPRHPHNQQDHAKPPVFVWTSSRPSVRTIHEKSSLITRILQRNWRNKHIGKNSRTRLPHRAIISVFGHVKLHSKTIRILVGSQLPHAKLMFNCENMC